jgi:hypothetical protein
MLLAQQIEHLPQGRRVAKRLTGGSPAIGKETLHAIGINSICANLVFGQPATEVGNDADFASDRMSRVVLTLKVRDELVDMRTQRSRVHASTCARKREECCCTHDIFSVQG